MKIVKFDPSLCERPPLNLCSLCAFGLNANVTTETRSQTSLTNSIKIHISVSEKRLPKK